MSSTLALRALLDVLDTDRALHEPQRWRARSEALDRLDALVPASRDDARADDAAPAGGLHRRAAATVARLEAIDAAYFAQVRERIRRGDGAAAMRECVLAEGACAADAARPGGAYDALDTLIGGVLRFDLAEAPADALDRDMVRYQPTPARHVLDLLDRLAPTRDDTLVDLGSGLGHVALLAAICTPARCLGIEWQPALVEGARRCARMLRLDGAVFLQGDARDADLSAGTVFYLYTPFTGAILRAVLDALRREAAARAIRVCTFGPCTATVAAEAWLRTDEPPRADRVVVWRSRQPPPARPRPRLESAPAAPISTARFAFPPLDSDA